MSMDSVTGRVGLGETRGGGAGAAAAGGGMAGAVGTAGVEPEVAICWNCTACGRDCNHVIEGFSQKGYVARLQPLN